jgi:hypothetical protein
MADQIKRLCILTFCLSIFSVVYIWHFYYSSSIFCINEYQKEKKPASFVGFATKIIQLNV